jgi:site-specific DNA recombinase
MPIRPFGYETDRTTLRPPEDAAIRDAVDRILAGEPVNALVRDWNDRGIRTPTGNAWQYGVLRRMLMSERIAGLRRTPAGELEDAPYPAIIDRATYDRLVTELTARTSARPKPSTTIAYLLSGGPAVCGLCGTQLVTKAAVKGQRSYVCASAAPKHGCGKIRIKGQLLDDEVSLRIMAKLRAAGAKKWVSGLVQGVNYRADQASRVIDEARTALADLGEEYARGRVTSETMNAATATLKTEMAEARRTVRLAEDLKDIALEDAPNFVQWWEGASLGQQRTVVGVLIRQVAVMPPPVKGSKIFAPERVKIRWN